MHFSGHNSCGYNYYIAIDAVNFFASAKTPVARAKALVSPGVAMPQDFSTASHYIPFSPPGLLF